ncbi:hypothetical protein BaRGS_00027746 [Batillaria attramentaria]|uniref:Uncharacterized protein n=1 Tax=Batillaria attramentaria TaxID=370345 RepID=A0ABD0K0Z5_9CAEN
MAFNPYALLHADTPCVVPVYKVWVSSASCIFLSDLWVHAIKGQYVTSIHFTLPPRGSSPHAKLGQSLTLVNFRVDGFVICRFQRATPVIRVFSFLFTTNQGYWTTQHRKPGSAGGKCTTVNFF